MNVSVTELMDVLHLCRCCLRRSPDKDFTSPYNNQGKTEIYAQMLQECYNIPLLLSGLGSSGICSVCVDRLREAHDFKRQVQWSQAQLQEWLKGELSDKGEAPSPSRATDERRSKSRWLRSRSRSQLRRGPFDSPPRKSRSGLRSRQLSSASRSRATDSRDSGVTSRTSGSKAKRPYDSRRSSSRNGRKRRRSRSRSQSAKVRRRSRSQSAKVRRRSRSHSGKVRRRSRSQSAEVKRRSRSQSVEVKRRSRSQSAKVKRRSRSHSVKRRRSRSQSAKVKRNSQSGTARRRLRCLRSRSSSMSSRTPSPIYRSAKRASPAALSQKSTPIVQQVKQNESEEHTKKENTTAVKNLFDSVATVPEFDPSNRQLTMTIWIRKVSDCATMNKWSEKQLIHNALPKLKGLAQMWYENLPSVLFSWKDWQEKLLAAFPAKENYGQMLSAMVSRRARLEESLEDYYYDKVTLIKRVSEPITGRLAVECVLHGIDDDSIRLGEEAAQLCDLDSLLTYLREVQPVSDSKINIIDVKPPELTAQATIPELNIPVKCLNCNQDGHTFQQCPAPLKLCTIYQMVGHEADVGQCFANLPYVEKFEKCHNCNQEGHAPTQCPLLVMKCSICQIVGHSADQCYNGNIQQSGNFVTDSAYFEPTTSKRGERKKCFKCNVSGHVAKQCYANTQDVLENINDKSFETDVGNVNNEPKRCFNCNKEGHLLAQCPSTLIQCSLCERVGHTAKACYSSKDMSGNLLCKKCKLVGHSSAHCTTATTNKTCYKCKMIGHLAGACNKYMDDSVNSSTNVKNQCDNTNVKKNKKCAYCKKNGHIKEKCPMLIIKCYRCKRMGHSVGQCFAKKDKSGNLLVKNDSTETSSTDKKIWRVKCNKCKQKGHTAAMCTMITTQNEKEEASSEDLKDIEHRDTFDDNTIEKCYNCNQEGHKLYNCPMPVKASSLSMLM